MGMNIVGLGGKEGGRMERKEKNISEFYINYVKPL